MVKAVVVALVTVIGSVVLLLAVLVMAMMREVIAVVTMASRSWLQYIDCN